MNCQLLFIIGMPRSGTKLLRDLLNRHGDIAILPNESHVFPYYARQLHRFGDLGEFENFKKFYHSFTHTTFYQRIQDKGITISCEKWYASLQGYAFKHVLDGFFHNYALITGTPVVGDKTPSYMTQLPFLAGLYPRARFIHIFRDPRDYAVSMKKAWGKNRIRAVQRWKQQITQCRQDARKTGVAFHELSYEGLLTDPQNTLEAVCTFVGIPFQKRMLQLARPSENLGDTKGQRIIVRDNYAKWKYRLSAREIRLMEEIAGELMEKLGYRTRFTAGNRDIKASAMFIYKIIDSLNLFAHHLKQEKGLLAAIRVITGALKHGAK